jgi:hypothetical protein
MGSSQAPLCTTRPAFTSGPYRAIHAETYATVQVQTALCVNAALWSVTSGMLLAIAYGPEIGWASILAAARSQETQVLEEKLRPPE